MKHEICWPRFDWSDFTSITVQCSKNSTRLDWMIATGFLSGVKWSVSVVERSLIRTCYLEVR